jgi:DNA-binding MarR family transcriptional regulator
MHKAHRQVHIFLEDACREEGVTPPEMHMLSYVQRYGPCPMKELVRIFGHKPSTLTSLLDRLANQGLLERLPNPGDRRSYLVAATAAVGPIVMRCGEILENFERELLAQVTPEELRGFLAVLSAVNDKTQVDVRQIPVESKPKKKKGDSNESD